MDLENSRRRLNGIMPALNDEQRSYMHEAIPLIEEGETRGIPLRLLGSTAVLLNCPNHVALYQEMDRRLTDIDVVAYLKKDRQLDAMLADLGYVVKGGRGVTMEVFLSRMIYVNEETDRRSVDVFFDKLDFCHPIDFTNRLDVGDFYTIPLSDLLLEKMQIVEINEKDLKDMLLLLLEHEFSQEEHLGIGIERLTSVLCSDWGFYYTATQNLKKLVEYARASDWLTPSQKTLISQQRDTLMTLLDGVPKTAKWRLRSKIGTRKRWYREVGEGYRDIPT
jgi:hypothetical protein